MTDIPGRASYHRLRAALRQKAPPVASEKLHLTVCSLVGHELLWIRQWRQGFGFSLEASKQCSPLCGRDHLVPLMRQQQKLIGSEAICLRIAGRIGNASVVWEKKRRKDYHGLNKCLQETLDYTTRADTGAAVTRVFAISVGFFCQSGNNSHRKKTWKNNFCSSKEKKNPDKDRDSECRREKKQGKRSAHFISLKKTTWMFCCWMCRTGSRSKNMLKTTSYNITLLVKHQPQHPD